jgi:hypothetical protein
MRLTQSDALAVWERLRAARTWEVVIVAEGWATDRSFHFTPEWCQAISAEFVGVPVGAHEGLGHVEMAVYREADGVPATSTVGHIIAARSVAGTGVLGHVRLVEARQALHDLLLVIYAAGALGDRLGLSLVPGPTRILAVDIVAYPHAGGRFLTPVEEL